MKILSEKSLNIFFLLLILLSVNTIFAQDEIDIVDPYEMKVSRSKEADTFYFTQKNIDINNKAKLDTLRSYDVFLEERPTPFGTAYMCNGKEVTKQQYLNYKKLWNAYGACTPCLLYTYDDKDELKYTAYQYEDCLCGEYKEYYKDKKIKLVGQFKQNTTANWDNYKMRNICNIRDGLWTYYFEDGSVQKTELYEDGRLKESKQPFVNTVSTSNNNQSSENIEESTTDDTTKKNVFQRLKDKNKKSK